LVDLKRIDIFKKTNSEYIDCVRKNTIDFDWDCNFLNTPKKDYKDLINYFDEYKFDGKAPKRIINFLINGNNNKTT
jgi:hypothetical protein